MSMLDEMYEQALEGMDERIDVSWYDRLTVYNSEHFYTKVDRIEVHRVLSEGDASRLNRGRPESEAALRYRPSDTYHGFDSVEDARAAGEVALADLDGERVGFDSEDGRMLVIRREGRWEPISMDDYWVMVDKRDAAEPRERRARHNHLTRDIKPLGQCPACDAYHEHKKEQQ